MKKLFTVLFLSFAIYSLQGQCVSTGSLAVNVQNCTSIEEETKTPFSIYPNPTLVNGAFSLQFEEPTQEEIRLSLTDITGKLLYVQSIEIGSLEVPIAMNAFLPAGVYTVRLEGNHTTASRILSVR